MVNGVMELAKVKLIKEKLNAFQIGKTKALYVREPS